MVTYFCTDQAQLNCCFEQRFVFWPTEDKWTKERKMKNFKIMLLFIQQKQNPINLICSLFCKTKHLTKISKEQSKKKKIKFNWICFYEKWRESKTQLIFIQINSWRLLWIPTLSFFLLVKKWTIKLKKKMLIIFACHFLAKFIFFYSDSVSMVNIDSHCSALSFHVSFMEKYNVTWQTVSISLVWQC